LASSNPVYLALAAAKGDDDLLIVKVEVAETQHYPDEDFVAYVMNGGHGEETTVLTKLLQALYREPF
jgi:hypothetical protein